MTSALADPLLVWTDAKLAILQSASLIPPCPTSRFFMGIKQDPPVAPDETWTELIKLQQHKTLVRAEE